MLPRKGVEHVGLYERAGKVTPTDHINLTGDYRRPKDTGLGRRKLPLNGFPASKQLNNPYV